MVGVRATLIVGVGAEEDEEVINGFFGGSGLPGGLRVSFGEAGQAGQAQRYRRCAKRNGAVETRS